jgi:4-amino-4-deoxy-L-arabinose transferase-like glycosyltransferase
MNAKGTVPLHWRWAALLGLIYAVSLAFTTTRFRLLDADELTHARVALEAAREGHWLPLTLEGKPWPDKPPAMIWLAAGAMKLLGPTELAVRLWPLLFAGAAFALAILLALELGLAASASVGLALCLGLSRDWLYHARFLSMDSGILALGLAAALAWARERRGAAACCLAGIALLKSWFALAWALPFVFVLLFEQPKREPLLPAILRLLAPTFGALALWLAISAWAYGPSALGLAFGHELLDRFSGQGHPSSAPPPRFYLAWSRAFFPLSLASAVALAGVAVRQGRSLLRGTTAWAWCFLAAWGLGLFLVRVTVFHYYLPWGTVAVLLWAVQWPRVSAAAWALWGLSILALAWAGDRGSVSHLSLLAMLMPALAAGALPPQAPRPYRALAGLLLSAVLALGGVDYALHPPDPNGPLVHALIQGQDRASELRILGPQTQAPAFYGGRKALFFMEETALPPGPYLRSQDGQWLEKRRP